MNFNKLDLNLLVVFDAIFEEGSITRASEKLNLTQSAVSNALNRLRHSMEDDLFFRSGDKMQPTPAALEYVAPIKKALELIDSTLNKDAFNPKDSEKTFIFAFPDVAAARVLPSLVKTLQDEAPNIKIINIALEPGILDKLKNHDIDFILAADPHMSSEYQSQVGQRFDEYFESFEVYSDEYRCVLRKENPLIKNGLISFDDYMSADHIYISIDGTSASPIDSTLLSMNQYRKRIMSVNYYQAAKEIIKNTDCVVSLSNNVSNLMNDKDEFAILPLPFEAEGFLVKLIWNKRSSNDPANKWMRNILFNIRDEIFPES